MNIPVAPAQGQKMLQVLVLLTLAGLVVVGLLPDDGKRNPGVTALMLSLTAGLALVFWLAPRRLSYTLTDGALLVGKLTGPLTLPYAGMTARRASRGLGARMGGTGLPGYHSGNHVYSTDGVQNVQAAASTPTGGVLLTSGDRTYYLTPADPDAFLRELAARGVQVRA